MRTFWENDSEPLTAGEHAGEYAATIDHEDGSAVSRYYGRTHKEVADKLLVAQGNASQRIRELRSETLRSAQPDPAQPASEFRPRDLTADERYDIARAVTDPVRAAEAIEQVVEAKLGPLGKIRERLDQDEETRRAEAARAEAKAFAASTPDYFPCAHNVTSMLNYMKHRDMAHTRKNFAIAFEELKAVGLIVFSAPSTEQSATTPGAQPATPNEPTAQTTTRPRLAASTGLRSTDASAQPHAGSRAEKYTLADIEAMSSREYHAKVSGEPGFRELVDRLTGQPARR